MQLMNEAIRALRFCGLRFAGVLLAALQLASGSAWAQQSPPKGVFIGRLQAGLQNHNILRLSQSVYAANADGMFVLEALDHYHDTARNEASLTRLQVYFGGPLPHKNRASAFGWVGRLEGVDAPGAELADARLGLQLTVNRLPGLDQWFRAQKADLFVQVFPVRTNRDFGRFDTFTRYSKRFAPKLVTRGFVRSYHLSQGTVVVFENDLIYEISREVDVLFRVGKGNRDVAGLSEKRWTAGIGMRLNF
ncbi:MAG: hypothetical protein H0X13_00460 [Ramlibacter sp.]|nr:hypothetical protein [Ramlibacter sp.]